MNEKTRAAAISLMNQLQDLELSPQEVAESVALAWCGTIAASYRIYERGVEKKKVDPVEGMTWEEFIRLNLDQLKARLEKMRAENAALHP